MNKKMKKQLHRIIISGIMLLFSMLVSINVKYINNIIFIIAYFIIGYDILLKAFRNISLLLKHFKLGVLPIATNTASYAKYKIP